jgi:hypothetical protein
MQPFPARCRIEPGGGPVEEGPCTVALAEGALTVAPSGRPSLRIRLSELAAWTVEDHAVTVDLGAGARVVLWQMGRQLDPFCSALPAARVEHLGQALLLLERGAAGEETGEFRWRGEPAEACRVRLQRTSLVVFPRESLPFRVGLGELRGVDFDEGSYALVLALDGERVLELLRFGKRTDALRAGLRERRDALAARTLRALGALAPDLPALALRALGAVLPDGIPASRAALDQAAPGAWDAIFARAFADADRRAAAQLLASRTEEAWVAVKETAPSDSESGPDADADSDSDAETHTETHADADSENGAEGRPARRSSTLPRELAGREVLYLFRIGRALALEVPTSTESATYVFRAREAGDRPALEVVRALSAIQFRREPISLPEPELQGARGSRYLEALKLVPGLQDARAAFLGRAIHSSGDGWQRALQAALDRA